VGFLRAITDRRRVWKPEELLDIAFAEPADFAPDSEFGYCNTNYILLGMIIERITGQSLTDVFTQRLFIPLGMRTTVMPAPDDASMPVPFVHGYQYGSVEKASSTDPALPADQQAQAAGTLRPDDWSEYNPSRGWAAGSAISTPDDLVAWAEALVGGALLDPATQRMRMTSIKGRGPANPEAAGYGYGYGIQKQQSYYGHSGTIAGYNTEILRDPDTDTDTTIVVVASVTVAPDGTPVAPTLASTVINALP
jgi:D-alanyl-D-alanine carboxypeptidase